MSDLVDGYPEDLRGEIDRLRAALDACADYGDRQQGEIERLKLVCRDQAGVELSEENDRLIVEIERLTTERDELLALLRGALHHVRNEGDVTLETIIRAVIAEAEGK
jgi:hypothetical protein